MFTEKISLFSIAAKQYLYKFKASSMIGLIIMQLLGLGVTLNGISRFVFPSVIVQGYSNNLIFLFSLLWVVIIAAWRPDRLKKNIDFTLVSNRISSALSDLYLILTFCLLGGITASLYSPVLRSLIYWGGGDTLIIHEGFRIPLSVLGLDILSSVCYMALAGCFAYFLGTLYQFNKLFIIMIPAGIIGLMRQESMLKSLWAFFTQESSLILFLVKGVLTAAVLFACSVFLQNRIEVKK